MFNALSGLHKMQRGMPQPGALASYVLVEEALARAKEEQRRRQSRWARHARHDAACC